LVEDDQRCLIKRCQMVGDYMAYSHDLYATYMPVMGFTLGSTFATKMASKKEDGDAEALRQCEVYVEKHNIQAILKDCIVQLCIKKPDNPHRFLKEYFEKLEKEYEADSLDYTEPEQKHEIEDHPSLGKGFYLRRRYAVSAAPMTEEDATSYVKKVIFFDLLAFVDEKNTSNLKLVLAFFRWYLKTTRLRLPFRRLLPRTSCFLTWTKEKGVIFLTLCVW